MPSIGADVSIFTEDLVGREPEPTAVFCEALVCEGAVMWGEDEMMLPPFFMVVAPAGDDDAEIQTALLALPHCSGVSLRTRKQPAAVLGQGGYLRERRDVQSVVSDLENTPSCGERQEIG